MGIYDPTCRDQVDGGEMDVPSVINPIGINLESDRSSERACYPVQ